MIIMGFNVFKANWLKYLLYIGVFWVAAISGQSCYGEEISFHSGVGGTVSTHIIREDDSLVELARHYDIGFNEIESANPGVDPFTPRVGISVLISRRWILPEVEARNGIVINLAEMRLYYFNKRSKARIDTFPIGIGDEGWNTPVGAYRIIEKIVNPVWYVPASIRAQKPELPGVVPAGPENPLGTHALRLSIGTILIHGTDRPFGIGRRVSHGCIHLYPEDIVRLFKKVRNGTRVVIVQQPVKAATVNNRVLVEIHPADGADLEYEAVNLLERKELIERVDMDRLQTALLTKSGIPTDITRD